MEYKDYYKGLKIVNEKENRGMLMSRLEMISIIDKDVPLTVFLDDDDLLNLHEVEVLPYPKYSFNYVMLTKVNQLLRVLNKYTNPSELVITDGCEFKLRYGISGNIYKTEFLKAYRDYLYKSNFIMKMFEIMGTSIINTAEDDILDTLAYKWWHKNNEGSYSLISETCGLYWNMIESTIGRYDVKNDPRYSTGDINEAEVKLNEKLAKIFDEFDKLLE
jgi:hypothetical protein